MDNTAFDKDGEPTIISTSFDVSETTDFRSSTPEQLANGGDEWKKDIEGDVYEIPIEMGDGEKKVVIIEEMEVAKEQAVKPYPDMGKEDLLRFSETVFWQRARLISILVFWAAWLALLGAVIGLTIVAPRCDSQPEPQWWQKTVVYQVYIRSFYDTNNDGIGDINGIKEKLDYLKELGVGAILVSSFYDSDNGAAGTADYGYQVRDHTAIQPTYGTMSEFEVLVNETHSRNMAILVDFIPNYTSKSHLWFVQSSADAEYSNTYWNHYVWAKCDNSTVVNTWRTVFGQPAWTVSGTRCYLHQFLDTEPELNLRSTAVQGELEKILHFWLDKGVDGFRVVGSAYLFESSDFSNDSNICEPQDFTNYDCFDHKYTRSQPENFELIARWRSIVDSYTSVGPGRRILLTDGNVEVQKAMNFYGPNGRGGGANLPINYQLTKTNDTCNSKCVGDLVYEWLNQMPYNSTADWLTGDQDRSRQRTRVGGETFVNLFNMIKMTLPGTALVYYGEEIGMENGGNTTFDPAGLINPKYSRDGYRTPMQWTNDTFAGFTNGTQPPWIPIPNNANSDPWNVNAQKTLKGGVMDQLRILIQMRSDEKSLQYGKLHKSTQDQVFSFVREHEGNNRILVVGSFGNDAGTSSVDLTKYSPDIGIPSSAEVTFVTNSTMTQKVGSSTDLKSVSLIPGQGFIAKWPYARP